MISSLASPSVAPQGSKSRVVVVQQVSYYREGYEPATVAIPFSMGSEAEEQEYVRELTVGESWIPLDTGWVKRAALITIVNDEGVFQRQPTPEVLAEVAARIVEVGIGGEPFLRIGPKQMQPWQPVKRAQIRCQKGKARITIHVYPG